MRWQRAGRVDQAGEAGEIVRVEQALDRHVDLRRVGQEGVAVAVDEARGLEMAVQALDAERAARRGGKWSRMPSSISTSRPEPLGGHCQTS